MSGNEWFDRRIVRFALGLLDDEEESRFRELRARDDACRRAWDEHMGGEALDAEAVSDAGVHTPNAEERHLPPAMIARWPDARVRLTGLEREIVAAHLTRCPTCREDLVTFGFEPVLDVDPRVRDLPSAAGVAAGPATTVMPERGGPHESEHGAGPGRPARNRRPPAPRRWPFFWGVFTGAAAGAVAAALLLSVRPPALAPGDGALPWVAPARLRGAPAAEVTIAPGTERIALALGVPQATDLDVPATVAVTGAGGHRLLETTLAPEHLDAGTVFVVLSIRGGVPAGTYEVRVTQPASGVDEPTVFTVVHTSP